MPYSRVMSLALMVAIAILIHPAATYAADDGILTFESAQASLTPSADLDEAMSSQTVPLDASGDRPLSSLTVPTAAAIVPSRAPQPDAPLPPPPDLPIQPPSGVEAGIEPSASIPDGELTPTLDAASEAAVALTFELSPAAVTPPSPDNTPPGAALPAHPTDSPSSLDEMFANGSDSLVAKAVGHAEGTRTAEGDRTWAYYGHTDPGNQVWNLGSFSYQHGASSPEEADEKQLRRLKGQAVTLLQQAQELGLTLNLEEQLNAFDLANQSPRAALSRGGYMERLKEARQMGLVGAEAVLWARVRSYMDPDTQRWNAPGLGNTAEGITRDQRRRQNAIHRAIATDQARQQDGQTEGAIATSAPIPSAPIETPPAPRPSVATTVDRILNLPGFQFNPFL